MKKKFVGTGPTNMGDQYDLVAEVKLVKKMGDSYKVIIKDVFNPKSQSVNNIFLNQKTLADEDEVEWYD